MTPEALRTIAAWLDLTDQMLTDVVEGRGISVPIEWLLTSLNGSEMQDDIRRWADEMELDS
jgi:hypothetical protein